MNRTPLYSQRGSWIFHWLSSLLRVWCIKACSLPSAGWIKSLSQCNTALYTALLTHCPTYTHQSVESHCLAEAKHRGSAVVSYLIHESYAKKKLTSWYMRHLQTIQYRYANIHLLTKQRFILITFWITVYVYLSSYTPCLFFSLDHIIQ